MTLPKVRRTLDGISGSELLELGAERVPARRQVHGGVRRRLGVVHGDSCCGYAAMFASGATVVDVAGNDETAMGLSPTTQFLRSANDEILTPAGRACRPGRTVRDWDIGFAAGGAGRFRAISCMTLAVRAAPPGSPRRVNVRAEAQSQEALARRLRHTPSAAHLDTNTRRPAR
jgi:acyl-coenzyme A thioesterase PaaI-like protein